MASGSSKKQDSGSLALDKDESTPPKVDTVSMELDPNIRNDVITVQGQEFLVNKKYLASISGYCHQIFEGNFMETATGNNEIKELSPENFSLFLKVIRDEHCLNEGNINEALEFFQYIQCQLAIQKCEKWLLGETSMMPKLKFELAVTYNMNKLMRAVVKDFKTIFDLKPILPGNSNLSTWDRATLETVLKKTLRLFAIPKLTPGGEFPYHEKIWCEVEHLKQQEEAVKKRIAEKKHAARELSDIHMKQDFLSRKMDYFKMKLEKTQGYLAQLPETAKRASRDKLEARIEEIIENIADYNEEHEELAEASLKYM